MVLSFMASKWCPSTISLLPVAVTMMSASGMAVSIRFTGKPSMAACNAQMGSISVTITRAPAPRNEAADPLPTSP